MCMGLHRNPKLAREVIYSDGKPYRETEVQLIRELTDRGKVLSTGANMR